VALLGELICVKQLYKDDLLNAAAVKMLFE